MVEGSIAIDNGTIVAVGDAQHLPDADEVVNTSGRLVMPGVIDPHVHIDGYLSVDPYRQGTAAAALGGVTTCINFAWQAWVGELSIWDEPGTLLEAVRRQKRKGKDTIIDYGLHGTITREDLTVFDELDDVIDEGVTSFKMFTAYEIGLSNGFIHSVLEELAPRDVVAVFHTEDDSICTTLTEKLKHEDKREPTNYPAARPDYAEAMAAEDCVRMATELGVKYYGIHTSCREAADVLAEFRKDGSEVRAETCTHYTALDESAYAEQGTLPIIAPPLRTSDDIDAMFEHLRLGTLSVVSTDHVAFEREQKEVDAWWDSGFGANGLQASFPVFHDIAVNQRGFSYPFLVRTMCTNPARTFGMPEKGTLEPGTDADLIIFDPDESYTITADDNASVADYSIYEGRTVTGRVKQTILRGEVIAEDGEVTAPPGYGEFVPRERPDWEP